MKWLFSRKKTNRKVVLRQNSNLSKPITKRKIKDSEDKNDLHHQWIRSYKWLWFMFLGVCMYVFLFSSFLEIDTVHVISANDQLRSDIALLAEQDLSGKKFFVFPKDNFFLFSLRQFKQDVLNRFSHVKSIDVTKQFPGTVLIQVDEQPMAVVWCSYDQCFLVNDDGFAYDTVDTGRFPSDTLIIHDASNWPVQSKSGVLDYDFVKSLSGIAKDFHDKSGIDIEMECSTPSKLSYTLTFKTKEGWDLLVDTRIDIDVLTSTLNLLLKKEINSDKRSKLQYIDLRTENRAYYLLKNEDASENTDKNTSDSSNQIDTKEGDAGTEKK